MTLILTFLGKGGTGRTTVAIAAAQKLASEGKRVLLLSQEAGPVLSILLGSAVTVTPSAVTGNGKVLTGGFFAVQLQTTTLLEENWEKLKKFEKEAKCCNELILCAGKTQPVLSDMVANKTHQRTPPLLQDAFQTF